MAIELKVIQIQACTLLATGKTVTDTAKELGLSRVTISRWLNSDNDFIAYFNALKMEQLEVARVQIQHIATLAVDTLTDVMTKSKNDVARIAASKEVLAMSGLTKDSLDLYALGIGAETEKLLSALSGF